MTKSQRYALSAVVVLVLLYFFTAPVNKVLGFAIDVAYRGENKTVAIALGTLLLMNIIFTSIASALCTGVVLKYLLGIYAYLVYAILASINIYFIGFLQGKGEPSAIVALTTLSIIAVTFLGSLVFNENE